MIRMPLELHSNATRSDQPLELAVVVPVLNESANIPILVSRLERVLAGTRWEAIFVDDDSSDGSAAVVHSIGSVDPRVRCIRRIGRRGLASAVIEGMLATSARYIAVIDGDLQHDEELLSRMLSRIQMGDLDLVVASRYVAGGSVGDLAASRVRLSGLGSWMSRLVIQHELTDPMSGFFMISRSFVEEEVHGLCGVGFKILLDIVASAHRKPRIAETPYTFRARRLGESKLDVNVQLEYAYLLLDKAAGRFIPLRFLLFALVGSFGVVVHLVAIGLLYSFLRLGFSTAQLVSAYLTMFFNFGLNNVVTFRDRRLKGRAFYAGLLTFLVACTAGAIGNVSIAESLQRHGVPLYGASLFGLMIGSVWNYAVNQIVTWRRSVNIRTARRSAARVPAIAEGGGSGVLVHGS